MPLNAGQTFLGPLIPKNERPHLWIILSDPNSDGRILLVNCTSKAPPTDTTVILAPGDHEFIDKPSWIFYALAETPLVTNFEAEIKLGRYKKKQDLSCELLKKLQVGAFASEHTKEKHKEFLRAVGIINEEPEENEDCEKEA